MLSEQPDASSAKSENQIAFRNESSSYQIKRKPAAWCSSVELMVVKQQAAGVTKI
jgi:hypothetical protein